MVRNRVVAMECEAMERLGWSLNQLYLATLGYGSVGTMDDLRRHLATGDGLDTGAVAVLLATLHEGLLEQDEPSPFYVERAPAPQA